MGSSLSKLADKNFVIGFFIPALSLVLATVRVYGCPPWAGDVCAPSGDLFKDLTYLAIVVWVLAVLLVAANYSFYRLLEGYLLPASWQGHLKKSPRERLEALLKREKEFEREGKTGEASSLRYQRLREYPSDPAEVAPTSFGNAIRAFEVYPREIYGADSISVWPRLLAVIPKDVRQSIDDAHALVDLFVNVCVLAGGLAVAAAFRFVWLIVEDIAGWSALATSDDLLVAGLATIASAAVAVLGYRRAVERVDSWGNAVKAAFDCYLPALAAQMGYTLPASDDSRRAFWWAFSRQALYRRTPLDADRWWTAAVAEAAGATPSQAQSSTAAPATTAPAPIATQAADRKSAASAGKAEDDDDDNDDEDDDDEKRASSG